jgi:cytochrome c
VTALGSWYRAHTLPRPARLGPIPISRSLTILSIVGAGWAASNCGSDEPIAPADSVDAAPEVPRDVRLLFFSRTAGFRHPSIDDAKRFFEGLDAEAERLFVTISEDPAVFTDAGLSGFDVIAFVNTTGDVLDDAQQAAMQRFLRSGRGFVGVHAAADTEHDWAWYGDLVGAYFVSHPLLPLEATLTREDPENPSTRHFDETFRFHDEWYNFDRNPRHDHTVLLTVDEAAFYQESGEPMPTSPPGSPFMGEDHPVAWSKEFEGGRSFYTNLGHRPESWSDERFRTHLLAGIRWARQPAQFSRVVLSTKAKNPLALRVTPDGRVLYVERTGEVYVYNPRTGRVTAAIELEVDTTAENGLLGIALDPRFTDNRQVYLYHSAPIADPRPPGPPGQNLVSRFVLGEDDRIDPATRADIFAVPSERQCCHEGGQLEFLPDGTLLVGVGDNTNPHESGGAAPLDERPGRETFDSRRTAANPSDLRGKNGRAQSLPDRRGSRDRPDLLGRHRSRRAHGRPAGTTRLRRDRFRRHARRLRLALLHRRKHALCEL